MKELKMKENPRENPDILEDTATPWPERFTPLEREFVELLDKLEIHKLLSIEALVYYDHLFIQGVSVRKTAAYLGVSVGKVRYMKNLIVKQIKDKIKEENPDLWNELK